MSTIKTPKKLIEVALPLDAINEGAIVEKNNPFLKGHPRGLHLYWARRPIAVARAVLFAQLVNDPGFEQGEGFRRGVNKKEAELKREKLFEIIRKLVLWENTTNEEVLAEAREAIWESWRETCELNRNHPQAAELFNPEKLPAFHDPFAGGGAIPLEAQRLGLESWASDLNPVAVLINKALIEIPTKFSGFSPIGPLPVLEAKKPKLHLDWSGSAGLAEDVRRYGIWLHQKVSEKLEDIYPPIVITEEMAKKRPDLLALVGEKLNVIAWIWARTVKSPSPAYSHVDVPLVSSFVLSSKKGKEAYVQPVINGDTYSFKVNIGSLPAEAKIGTKSAGSKSTFLCLLSGAPMDFKYLRDQGKKGLLSQKLMALVVESKKGRFFLSPDTFQENTAYTQLPQNPPETVLPEKALGFRVQEYGIEKFKQLFTNRQLVTLTTFCELIDDVKKKVYLDCLANGIHDDGLALEFGGKNASAYADMIATYLGLSISQYTRYFTTFAIWNSTNANIAHGFGRQAIPMTWDYPEANPLKGNLTILTAINWICESIQKLPVNVESFAYQQDAQTQNISRNKLISTDPPYYDNVAYADLSDFFYTWLRKSLKNTHTQLFSTVNTPKDLELVASPFRHGNKENADKFFMHGMTQAMHSLAIQAHPAFPITIYYAFKQSDTGDKGTASIGWETFLAAVLDAGLEISGTWPMKTERDNRMRAYESNALASSIILVCRTRSKDAITISRREFLTTLRSELPDALEAMIGGSTGFSPIAPVDLAQSAIGPGIAVFSRYASVLKADGEPMSVREALQLINEEIDRVLDPEASNSDVDTRFCVAWFDTVGWSEGAFGEADTLARAKGTSVAGLVEAGVIESGGGKVRLLRANEYPSDWDPAKDHRLPVWEALHHLVRLLSTSGEEGAGAVLAKLHDKSEAIRALAYRLYTLCERKGWAEDARGYNELVTSWHAIETASHRIGRRGAQPTLDLE